MLEMKDSNNFQGASKIDGVVAERYTATISEENPENLTFGRMISNMQLRKDNREQCRADQAEFEDAVYIVQDQMLQADAMKGETA